MALSFYALLEAALLVLNGIAILHRERFLKKYGLGAPSHSFDGSSTVKDQLVSLIFAVQTVMRSMPRIR
ncbi:Protein CBG13626 [Caenorhabditis briggsae]|uniref:Immediate early response 3-interacting protein 1 n=1 Tax=Caenorhabditis briggsae TaxID=6238 RepID=A8XIC3_CAEBR|nr:Protein CBG13626 [Caenorhabditis briggsae]CAP32397.2 Protein CBG13626 [Caenorhabditis briggsae]